MVKSKFFYLLYEHHGRGTEKGDKVSHQENTGGLHGVISSTVLGKTGQTLLYEITAVT
jgi:hypothetical protein